MNDNSFHVLTKEHPETLQVIQSFRDLFPSEEEMYQAVFNPWDGALNSKALPPQGPFRINEVAFGRGQVEFSSIVSWDGTHDLETIDLWFGFIEGDKIEFTTPTWYYRHKAHIS